jgi:hypothetical protein
VIVGATVHEVGTEEVYRDCRFTEGHDFDRCVVTASLFEECAFQGRSIIGSIFVSCFFDACDFDGCSLVNVKFLGCTFSECSLDGAYFDGIEIGGTSIVGLGLYLLGVGDNRGFCPYAARVAGNVVIFDTEYGMLSLAEAVEAYVPDRYYGRVSIARRWSNELNKLAGLERAGKLDWLAQLRD